MNKKYLNLFKEVVQSLAKQSHCVSYKVGCVIVKEGRIISTGWNGTFPNTINCDEKFPDYDPSIPEQREAHHEYSEISEIHAEMNAIIFAARSGIAIKDSEIVCSLQPCNNCLKNIIQAGIKSIYYINDYPRSNYDKYILEYIKNNNITLMKI